jgi:DNA mismatch repair protein MutL
VNVHPTKAEVRFREQSYMHEIVRRTLADALGQGPVPELRLEPPRTADPRATTLPLPAGYAATFPSRWAAPAGNRAIAPTGNRAIAPTGDRGFAPTGEAGFAPTRDSGFAPTSDSAVAPTREGAIGEAALAPTLRPMIPLGQFRDTFIVAVDEEGIAIIDQHVAHERVLFEQIVERLTAGRLESQRLLEPVIVELPAGARQALLGHAASMDRVGFDVEEFGGGSLRVSALPALLSRQECDAALRALAEDLEGLERGARVDEAIRQIAATMACHAAVKANYPLTMEKMTYILEELRRTAYSTICPHGRPVMLRLSRREVEKNFQRI